MTTETLWIPVPVSGAGQASRKEQRVSKSKRSAHQHNGSCVIPDAAQRGQALRGNDNITRTHHSVYARVLKIRCRRNSSGAGEGGPGCRWVISPYPKNDGGDAAASFRSCNRTVHIAVDAGAVSSALRQPLVPPVAWRLADAEPGGPCLMIAARSFGPGPACWRVIRLWKQSRFDDVSWRSPSHI